MEKLTKTNADDGRRQVNYETDCETVVLETDSELGVEKSIVVKCRQPFFCSTPKHNSTAEFYGTSTTELTDITRGIHNNTSDISRSSSARSSMIYSTTKVNRKEVRKRKGTYLNRSKPTKYITNTVRRKFNTLNGNGNVSSLVKKFKRLEAMLKVTLTHEGRRRKCVRSVDLAKLQHRYEANRRNSLNNESKCNAKSILVDNEKCISGFSSLTGAGDVNAKSLEDYECTHCY